MGGLRLGWLAQCCVAGNQERFVFNTVKIMLRADVRFFPRNRGHSIVQQRGNHRGPRQVVPYCCLHVAGNHTKIYASPHGVACTCIGREKSNAIVGDSNVLHEQKQIETCRESAGPRAMPRIPPSFLLSKAAEGSATDRVHRRNGSLRPVRPGHPVEHRINYFEERRNAGMRCHRCRIDSYSTTIFSGYCSVHPRQFLNTNGLARKTTNPVPSRARRRCQTPAHELRSTLVLTLGVPHCCSPARAKSTIFCQWKHVHRVCGETAQEIDSL